MVSWFAKRRRGVSSCSVDSRAWLACWHERGVRIAEQEPVVIKEYDYDDEEVRHLGYSAPMIGESAAAESALAATARCELR